MVIDFILGISILLGGIMLGQNTSGKLPEEWTQDDHSNMIRRCSISCGEDRFQGYKPLTGECNCKWGK